MEVVVTGDNWSYKTCEAPVKSSPVNQRFSQAGYPSCVTFHGPAHLKFTCVFQPHLWPLKAPGYFEGALPLPSLSSSFSLQYHTLTNDWLPDKIERKLRGSDLYRTTTPQGEFKCGSCVNKRIHLVVERFVLKFIKSTSFFFWWRSLIETETSTK